MKDDKNPIDTIVEISNHIKDNTNLDDYTKQIILSSALENKLNLTNDRRRIDNIIEVAQYDIPTGVKPNKPETNI